MPSSNDPYLERLSHPLWQKKKGEILVRDNHTCQSCYTHSGITLHAHHKKYDKNKDPWDYPDSNFITLCEVCHNTEHLVGPNLSIEDLIKEIRGYHLMTGMVAQLCVLVEEDEKFESELRWFLHKQINEYYSRRNERRGNG
jgi:hypothetical protein